MNLYTIDQLVSVARTGSPIYKSLYKNVAETGKITLRDLPIFSNKEMMRIVHGNDAGLMFASENASGILYQSSATTGKPKVTLFSQDEFSATNKLLAIHHWKNNVIKNGDIIANLCVAGSASFLLVHGTIEQFPGNCSEIPVGCDHEYQYLDDICRKFKANVLAGINSTILGFAWYVLSNAAVNLSIERIICGGELLYGGQIEIIKKAFPNAILIPFIYATTETGIIGYSRLGYPQNIFHVFNEACILEIINPETNEPIDTPGVLGTAVVTSLLRISAPAIRIDTGDYAQWEDDPSRENPRFSIHGRNFPFSHEINGVVFSETHIFNVIKHVEKKLQITKLQVELYAEHMKILISLLDNSLLEDERAFSYIQSSIAEVIPALTKTKTPIHYQIKPLEYFLESTKRKGRLIKDMR